MIMLIDNWKQAHKFLSVQLGLAGGILLTYADAAVNAWLAMPPEIVAMLPPEYIKPIGTVLCVAGFIARFIKQRSLHAD